MSIEEFNAYEKSEYIRMTKEYERMRDKYDDMYNTYHRWWNENIVFSMVAVAFFTFAGVVAWSAYIAACPHCPHCKEEAIRKAWTGEGLPPGYFEQIVQEGGAA